MLFLLRRVKVGSNNCQANHHSKLGCLADPFNDAIRDKTNIEKSNLSPQEPEYAEESSVRFEGRGLVDFMCICESRQVCNEKKIVEEFDVCSLFISTKLGSIREAMIPCLLIILFHIVSPVVVNVLSV